MYPVLLNLWPESVYIQLEHENNYREYSINACDLCIMESVTVTFFSFMLQF